MCKYIALLLVLLLINEIQSQINFANVNGPAVFENLSSVNEKGSSVVSIINGQVFEGSPTKAATASKVSSNAVIDSVTVQKQTSPQKVNKVNKVSSVQANTQVIKGPVVIQGTGSTVTPNQHKQNSNRQVPSLVTPKVNNKGQPHAVPSKVTPSPGGQHKNTQPQSWHPTTAKPHVESSKSKSSTTPSNKYTVPKYYTTKKPDVLVEAKIVFPKD